MHIKKKTFILLVIYFTAAVVALGGYAIAQTSIGTNYRATAEYGYEHAFNEVVKASKNLSAALHRGIYTTGAPMSAEVCSDIYGNCLAASMTMAALPFSTQELEQTSNFVSVAGDYAQAIMKSRAGTGFGDEERANMAELHKVAYKLYKNLEKLRTDINDGTVIMDAPEALFSSGTNVMSASMLEMESKMEKLPEIDYDGKYTKASTKTSENPVSEEKARKIAADFFGLKESELETVYSADSGMRCFGFKGGSITVNGDGKVLSMSTGRTVYGDTDSKKLERAAKKFLENAGFSDMVMTKSERQDSVQYMCFECAANGVRCESDCVKIGIAADNGKVYSFDATEYVENNGHHAEAKADITEAAAAKAIPDNLTVTGAELMYAETIGGSDRLCYDFTCRGTDDEKLHVLVDASSGEQFRIEI